MSIQITVHPIGREHKPETYDVLTGRRVLLGRDPQAEYFRSLERVPLDLVDMEQLGAGAFRAVPIVSRHLSEGNRRMSSSTSRIQLAILWTQYGEPRIVSLGKRPIYVQAVGETARPLVAPDQLLLGPAVTVWLPTDTERLAKRVTILNPHAKRRRGVPLPIDTVESGTLLVQQATTNRLLGAIAKASPLLEFPAPLLRPPLPPTPRFVLHDRLRGLKGDRGLLTTLLGGRFAGVVETEDQMLATLLNERHLTLDSIVALLPEIEELHRTAVAADADLRYTLGEGAEARDKLLAQGQLVEVLDKAAKRIRQLELLINEIESIAH